MIQPASHTTDVTIEQPEEGYWARNGGRDAGRAYYYTNIAWVALGLITDPTFQVAAAGAVNYFGSRARMKYSDKVAYGVPNFGNKVGASLGVVANFILTATEVLSLNPAALLSNAVIITAAYIDIRSGHYRTRYENHATPWLRETLGQSRRLVGLIRGSSRLPLVYLAVTTGNAPLMAIAAGLLVADTMYAFSQPMKEYGKGQTAAARPAGAVPLIPAVLKTDTDAVVYPAMPTRKAVRAKRLIMQAWRRPVQAAGRVRARILPAAKQFRVGLGAKRPKIAEILRHFKALPRHGYGRA